MTKPGPKPKHADGAVTPTSVTIDDMTRRRLLVLGKGNLSEGIRVSAAVAYHRYQVSPDSRNDLHVELAVEPAAKPVPPPVD
jgi:hypothetical protein